LVVESATSYEVAPVTDGQLSVGLKLTPVAVSAGTGLDPQNAHGCVTGKLDPAMAIDPERAEPLLLAESL
jgi:hypothetical protein